MTRVRTDLHGEHMSLYHDEQSIIRSLLLHETHVLLLTPSHATVKPTGEGQRHI